MASRDDAAPDGAAERHFRIGGQFYASVRARGRDARQVLVGGVKRGCVTIDVNLARRPPEGVLNVSYDQRCNAAGTLPRGVGTIALLRAALAFAFRQFPELAAVFFKDHAYVVCTPGRRYAIAPQNLALYGQTWYERAIGAVPDDARDARRLRAFAEHCLASPPPSWDAIAAAARSRGDAPVADDELRRRLEAAPNLRALVAGLRRDHGCAALEHWLPAYFNAFARGAVWFPEMDFRVDRAVALAAAPDDAEPLAEPPAHADAVARRERRRMRALDVLELAPPSRRAPTRRSGI